MIYKPKVSNMQKCKIRLKSQHSVPDVSEEKVFRPLGSKSSLQPAKTYSLALFAPVCLRKFPKLCFLRFSEHL